MSRTCPGTNPCNTIQNYAKPKPFSEPEAIANKTTQSPPTLHNPEAPATEHFLDTEPCLLVLGLVSVRQEPDSSPQRDVFLEFCKFCFSASHLSFYLRTLSQRNAQQKFCVLWPQSSHIRSTQPLILPMLCRSWPSRSLETAASYKVSTTIYFNAFVHLSMHPRSCNQNLIVSFMP